MTIEFGYFHFLRPYWLLLLIPLFILLWFSFKRLRQGDSWQKVCDKNLLPHLLVNRQHGISAWPIWMFAICLFILTFALAGPTWKKQIQPVYRSPQSVVIAVDLSDSMLAQDIKPDRISRAQYKVIDMLKRLADAQVGMVAFTNEAYTVSPITQDAQTIAAMVPSLTPNIMPVQGHNISAALDKSADLFQQAGVHKGTILLITDNTATSADDNTAKQLAAEGYKVSVLGVGTTAGAPVPDGSKGFYQNNQGQTIITKLDPQSLQQLAKDGDGRYATFSNTDSDIDYLLPESSQPLTQQVKQEQATITLWQDEGRWFLWLIIPFALLAFRRGWLEELL